MKEKENKCIYISNVRNEEFFICGVRNFNDCKYGCLSCNKQGFVEIPYLVDSVAKLFGSKSASKMIECASREAREELLVKTGC